MIPWRQRWEAFREALQTKAQVALGRLTQREQFMVVGGVAAAVLVVLGGIGWGVSVALDREEHRVSVKTQQLAQVLALQGDYRARQQERQARLEALSRSQVRLVSWVEEAARQAGVDMGQLRPEEGEPGVDGVVESRVDLRASDVSADKLQDFLTRLESGPDGVVVRRLKINRPYRKDVAELEMTVTTFKIKN